MSSVNKIQINETGKKDLLSIINKNISIKNDSISHKDEGKIQNSEKGKTKSCKIISIILISVVLLIIIIASIIILSILKKKIEKKKQ